MLNFEYVLNIDNTWICMEHNTAYIFGCKIQYRYLSFPE